MNASAGAVYQFNSGTLIKTFSPAVTGQRFGASLVWSGTEIFVGAPNDLASTGAVYACIFAGPSTCTKRFLNPFPSSSDQFGVAIAAIDGDLLVGANFGDEGTTDGGSSYLMNGSTGSLIRTFVKPDAEALDSFGIAVAAVGGNVVVGAIRHKVILPYGAHLAVSSGGAMSFDPSTGTETARYEKPVTIEVRDLVVRGNHAFFSAGLGDDPEKSRIFALNVSNGAIDASFAPPLTDGQDTFGTSLSHDGSRLLIGSPSEDAAYLVDSTTGQLLQTLLPNVTSFSFGYAVAFSDGDAVVGAPFEVQGGQTYAGAAYRFNSDSGSLIHKLVESPPVGGRSLARTIATLDGVLFAGAPSNSAFPDPGRVFAYDPVNGNELQIVMSPTPASNGQFGYDLITVDGRLVVGALFEDSNWKGRAHVFALNPGSQQWEATFNVSPTGSGVTNAQFGTIMAPFGRLALIGSPGAASSDGRVYVLDVRSGDLARIARPSNRDEGFGLQVGSDSDEWFVASAVTEIGAVPADQSWALYVVAATPNCGDGFVDAGEQCDGTECCSPSCTVLPLGSSCTDDGDACTFDQCDGDGMCAHPDATAGTTCQDDGVPCTLDQCDGNGACEHPPAGDGTSCQDTDACTSLDTCVSGICVGGPPTNCDDSNSCTTDICVSPSGCTHQPASGTCSDGNQCTFNDICNNGQCVGQCDVGAPCPLGPPCGGVGQCKLQGANCQCSAP